MSGDKDENDSKDEDGQGEADEVEDGVSHS